MDPSQWNIIIVDDEPDNVGVLEVVLSFHNATVRIADNGHKGLDLLKQQTPSFMLVDIQMPIMSGFELLAHIRKNHQWNHIPVIAVTAHSMSGDAERIKQAGFDGYIPKPINVMTLMDDLHKILEQHTS